jgi:hypothetical protein
LEESFIMAFTKNTFAGATTADGSLVNENFTEIYTCLGAFPGSHGSLNDGAVTADAIADNSITFAKLSAGLVELDSEGGGTGSLGGSDSQLPTSLAVKEYIDAQVTNLRFGFYGTGSTNNLAANSWTTCPLTGVYDIGNGFSSNIYTVPAAGTYKILVSARFNMQASTQVGVRIDIDGNAHGGTGESDGLYTNTDYTTPNVNYKQAMAYYKSIALTAGQKIKMQVIATGNSTVNSGTATHMHIYKSTAT